eukprot:SAG11_NODE_322_length_10757_cov_2.841809_3_plen_59_part_00
MSLAPGDVGPAKFGFVGGMLVVFVFLSYFAMQMEPPVDVSAQRPRRPDLFTVPCDWHL